VGFSGLRDERKKGRIEVGRYRKGNVLILFIVSLYGLW